MVNDLDFVFLKHAIMEATRKKENVGTNYSRCREGKSASSTVAFP